jgi:DNA-directed RNA polymerase specialized sigma24 family protein
MIATLTVCAEANRPAAEPDFLEMLPTIRRVASYAFRHLRRAVREDLMAEVIANAFAAFRRLVARGKAALAYPTVLARFAIRQVREGRRLGSQLNVHDVLSPYAQQRKQFSVQRLCNRREGGRWEDLVVEGKRSTPAEIAACRLDFRAWLRRLDRRRRAVALRLAAGESTKEAACRFGVSQCRISQVRAELKDSWQAFQG